MPYKEHPIDFVYLYLTHKFRDEIVIESFEGNSPYVCPTCNRNSDEWLEPNEYAMFDKMKLCIPCYTIRHGSFDLLGSDQNVNKEKTLKIGMLKGAGMLLTKEKSYLFAPGKHFTKMSSTPNLIFDEIIHLSAVTQEGISKAVQLAPNNAPYMFISNFGGVAQSLISNMRITLNPDEFIDCSVDNIGALSRVILANSNKLEGVEKPVKKLFFDLLMDRTERPLSESERSDILGLSEKHEILAFILANLPADPHDQLMTIKKVR